MTALKSLQEGNFAAGEQSAEEAFQNGYIKGWESASGNGGNGWIGSDADYESYINYRQNEIDGFNQFTSELSGPGAFAFYGGANLYEGAIGLGESIGGLTRFTGVQGGSAAGVAWTDLGTGLQNLASYAYNDLPGFASAIAVDPFINAYDRYADIYNNDGLAAMMGTMATDGLVKGILEGPTRGIGIDIPAVTKKGSAGNTSGSGSSQGSQSANNAGDFSTPPFEAGNPALDVAEGAMQHTTHSLNQKINRQVKSVDELDAIKNPLKKTDVKYDNQGRPSEKFIGENATVAVNPETGKVVTVHPTSSKLAERLKRQKEGEQ
ncbi:hypothetical protein QE250_15725 [Chromatiaceae bacterium AAb-1]|nr:hypothetical protein [Chromatiaceae bacterium AAb-1]